MHRLVRLSLLGPFIGIAVAIWAAERLEYDPLTAATEYWLVVIGISLLGLVSPWLLKGLYFQHTAFRAQRLSSRLHEKAMLALRDIPSVELREVADAKTPDQAELLTKLQAVAPIHHATLSLVIYDSPQRYLNVGQVAYQRLMVVTTTGSLAQTRPDELVKEVSELIVFHNLCIGGVFNPPEDHLPANTFLPMKEDTPFVIALTLYWQARWRHHKTNKMLGIPARPSFEVRAKQCDQRFRQENQFWL